MKFNDKLQKLRKEAQLNQEELAEKLEVSRQSVSKWESGTTYPEMDKLIALTKIFNCTLDDLTNDTISTDVISTRQKNGIYNLIDSALELIDQTLLLLKESTGTEIVKMFVKLVIISVVLMLGYIPFNILVNLGYDIFFNLPPEVGNVLSSLWRFIVVSSFVLLYIMVFVYLFKRLYLDTHKDKVITVTGDADEKVVQVEKESEIKQPKKFEKTDSFFKVLGSIIMFFVKCFVAMFVFFFIILSICTFIFLALEVVLLFNGVIYFGALLLTVSTICILYSMIIVLVNFLFDKTYNYQLLLKLFLASIACLGIGIGIFTFEVANTRFINDAPESFKLKTVTKEFKFSDELIVLFSGSNIMYQFVEENTLGDTIRMEVRYYEDVVTVDTADFEGSNGSMTKYVNVYSMDYNSYGMLNDFISNLRSKKIYNYNLLNEATIILYGTQSNLEKLQANLESYWNSLTVIEDKRDYYVEALESKVETLESEIDNLTDDLDVLRSTNENLEFENEELRLTIEDYKERLKGIIEE